MRRGEELGRKNRNLVADMYSVEWILLVEILNSLIGTDSHKINE